MWFSGVDKEKKGLDKWVLGYCCAERDQADVERQNLGDLLKRRGR